MRYYVLYSAAVYAKINDFLTVYLEFINGVASDLVVRLTDLGFGNLDGGKLEKE